MLNNQSLKVSLNYTLLPKFGTKKKQHVKLKKKKKNTSFNWNINWIPNMWYAIVTVL